MLCSDPYSLVLEELREINAIDSEEELRLALRATQKYVKMLRTGYQQMPAKVDYSCLHQKAAYLVAYYPHYISPLYHSLKFLTEKYRNDEYFQTLIAPSILGATIQRACFIGAGPAPEILGWIAFLDDYSRGTKKALAYLLDSHIWYTGQTLTRYHLAPKYWSDGKLWMLPLHFDITHSGGVWDDTILRAIEKSNLFVMQNCLSDQIQTIENLSENFERIFQKMKAGDVFIIIDLNNPKIVNIMAYMENVAKNTGCELLCSARDLTKTLQSNIPIPEIIHQELLTGEDGLISRRNVSFRMTAIYKPIPF